jgi:hypothetical protein
MLIPPSSATFKVIGSADEYQDSLQVRCSPVGYLDDAVVMHVRSDRAYPTARPSVTFDHQPHRDPSVDDIPAASAFVEAYAYLVDLAQWVVSRCATGARISSLEHSIEASLRFHKEVA